MSDDGGYGAIVVLKIILASACLVLAANQVLLATVIYGRVRPSFLSARTAGRVHRLLGALIALTLIVVATLCVTHYEIQDAIEHGGTRVTVHVVAAIGLLALLAVKVVVVRLGGRISVALPVLGLLVAALLTTTWASSALPCIADSSASCTGDYGGHHGGGDGGNSGPGGGDNSGHGGGD